jgi:signal-transduction protein with cAMP-binding, CBS, and nucleotidyltransferase domain
MSVAKFIDSVPLFKSLTSEDRKHIAENMSMETFAKGDQVFHQGEHGDAFYIVCDGEANVMVRPANFIKVNDEVTLATELTFAGKVVAPGTVCKVDKFDASRDYPYTVRVRGTGRVEH